MPAIYDVTAPLIGSVTVTPAMAAAGDSVHVSVSVTDNVGISAVSANEAFLANTSGSTWRGDIMACDAIGAQAVTVTAADLSGNIATDASGVYTTASIVGASLRSLGDRITKQATGFHLFRLWGRAVIQPDGTFTLDDGSGTVVNVIAPGHTVKTGDYISARGILDPDAEPITLTTEPAYIDNW